MARCILHAAKCVPLLHIFISPQPIITSDLTVNGRLLPRLENGRTLGHLQGARTGRFPRRADAEHKECGNAFMHEAHLSPFTSLELALLWLMRGKGQSWRTAYEKKTNVLQGALRLELLFSLLWFIGSIVTSSLPVLNVPLICSSRVCTWNNSLKMNEKKAKHWGLWDEGAGDGEIGKKVSEPRWRLWRLARCFA